MKYILFHSSFLHNCLAAAVVFQGPLGWNLLQPYISGLQLKRKKNKSVASCVYSTLSCQTPSHGLSGPLTAQVCLVRYFHLYFTWTRLASSLALLLTCLGGRAGGAGAPADSSVLGPESHVCSVCSVSIRVWLEGWRLNSTLD